MNKGGVRQFGIKDRISEITATELAAAATTTKFSGTQIIVAIICTWRAWHYEDIAVLLSLLVPPVHPVPGGQPHHLAQVGGHVRDSIHSLTQTHVTACQ